MTIVTNAGADDRMTRGARAAAEAVLVEEGVHQDLDSSARTAALRQERPNRPLLTLAAQASPITVDVGGGEQATFDDVVVKYELEDNEIPASVDTLWEVSLRPREDANWPFKRKGTQVGIRPTLTAVGWEAVLDHGTFCLRCFGRYRDPVNDEECVACDVAGVVHVDGGHPTTCHRCGLTPEHRTRAIEYLERVGEVHYIASAPRQVRRAQERAVRRPSGLILPGQNW